MALTEVSVAQKVGPRHVVPCADINKWMAINYDPKTADTANLLIPSSVTRAGALLGNMNWGATGFRARLRYTTGVAVTVNPIVQFVGIDENGVPQLLSDANGATSFTLTYDVAADLKDSAGNSYTKPTNLIDARNCKQIQVLVVTASQGGGTVDTSGLTATCPAIMVQCE